MMKDYLARLSVWIECLLSCFLVMVSCGNGAGGTYSEIEHPIDMRKTIRMQTSRIFGNVDTIKLEAVSFPVEEPEKLAVSDKRYFIQGGPRTIFSWRKDGKNARVLTTPSDITGFSIFEDRQIEVLSGFDVLEYDIEDFSLKNRVTVPDTTVKLGAVMRYNDQLYFVGYDRDSLYLCQYYLEYSVPNRSPYYHFGHPDFMGSRGLTSEAVKNSRFIKHGSDNDVMMASSGLVAYVWDFVSVIYKWRILGDDGKPVLFENIQMTDSMLYGSLRWDGAKYLLVLDTQKKKPVVYRSENDEEDFQLGTIRDNTNYYCRNVAGVDDSGLEILAYGLK